MALFDVVGPCAAIAIAVGVKVRALPVPLVVFPVAYATKRSGNSKNWNTPTYLPLSGYVMVPWPCLCPFTYAPVYAPPLAKV